MVKMLGQQLCRDLERVLIIQKETGTSRGVMYQRWPLKQLHVCCNLSQSCTGRIGQQVHLRKSQSGVVTAIRKSKETDMNFSYCS